MASRRTYWAAHSSPEATVQETVVAETNFVTGFEGAAPDPTNSFRPPAGQDLHIVSIGMSVEPSTAEVIGRLRMREGATTSRDVFWTHVLVAAADGDSPSEVFSFPEGTFVIPAGQQFCFTVKTGTTGTRMHFVASGYLEPRTG